MLDVPDHWGMLADCYVKAGRRDSAIALYAQKLIDLGMQDPRWGSGFRAAGGAQDSGRQVGLRV